MADYHELRRDHFGVVLQHTQSQLTFLLREYTYASEAAFEKERTRLETEAGTPSDHVLTVVKVRAHTFHGLCSTSHKVMAVYEYPQVTLQDEIAARLKEEKRFD
jgi:hypothetical protein